MKKITAYVLSFSEFNKKTKKVDVKQIGIYETAQEAITHIEASALLAPENKKWAFYREKNPGTFVAAWTAINTETGDRIRFDVGARDAWIGDLDEPVPAGAAHAYVL